MSDLEDSVSRETTALVRGRTFFHVGFHKTASSMLQRWFFPSLRPTVHFAGGDRVGKALTYSLRLDPNPQFSVETARAYVASWVGKGARSVLFSSEGFSGLPWGDWVGREEVFRRFRAIDPNAGLVAFVRRQPSMIASLYGQYINEGGTRTLEEFLVGEEGSSPTFDLSHVEYDRWIELAVSTFGEDGVLVVPYEALRDDRDLVLRTLAGFLGHAGEDLSGGEKRENVSLSPLLLGGLRAINRMFRASSLNPSPTVIRVPRAGKARYLLQTYVNPRLPRALQQRSHLEDRVARLLDMSRYSASNQRMQRHCSWELGRFGYH